MPAKSQNIVLMFVRHPEPGKVKTRLAATIGDEQACAMYQLITEDQSHRLRQSSTELDFRLLFFATPADKLAPVVMWLNDGRPPVIDAIPQPERDLAGRMDYAVEQGLGALKGSRVCIIGSDCPDIDGEIIDQAFTLLEDQDAVFGRAGDGGFYLFATRRYEPGLFDGVIYSQNDTADQLIESLRGRDWRVDSETLPVLQDLDEESDWIKISEAGRERLRVLAQERGVILPE